MRRSVLLVTAVLLAGVACGDNGGSNQVSTGAAAGCTVGPEPSGPLVDDGGLVLPDVAPPADWVAPPQTGFDWDGDGAEDVLAFDQAAAEIRVEWADGALTVTGVRSDFTGEPGQPIEPGGDPFLEQPTESGPPPPDVVDEGLAAPIPAAAADVTGDDQLDLLVVDGGTAAVVVGLGEDSVDTTVAVERIGGDVAGWRNPPVVPRPPSGTSADQLPVPYDQATVVPQWDLTGDEVDDWIVVSHLPRAQGPVAAYAGKPCA